MKKIVNLFIAAALLFVGNVTYAQSSLTNAAGRVLDTVTNSGTKFLTSPRIAGAKDETIVTGTATKISGTVAGTVYLYGSQDNSVFVRVRTAQLRGAQVDSLILTNTAPAQPVSFVVIGNPFQYYRIQSTGSGTSTYQLKGNVVSH